jgi:hypothetical protein
MNPLPENEAHVIREKIVSVHIIIAWSTDMNVVIHLRFESIENYTI